MEGITIMPCLVVKHICIDHTALDEVKPFLVFPVSNFKIFNVGLPSFNPIIISLLACNQDKAIGKNSGEKVCKEVVICGQVS